MLFSQLTSGLSQRFGVEAAVNMLADAGFPAVDVTMADYPDPPLCEDWRDLTQKLIKIGKERNIKYVQSHAPFGNYEFTVNEVIPRLDDIFECSAMLGIPYVVVHPIMQGHYYDDKQGMFDRNIEFYTSIAPRAKRAGVKIAIENMWDVHRCVRRICDSICADPYELAAMYDTLNDPEAFTVCLDLGHVAICGREPEDAIRIIGKERLGCIHAHDVDYVDDLHTLPGAGKIRWNNVCRALADIDYEGVFTLEANGFYRNFDNEFLPTVLKFMADTARRLCEKIEGYKAEIVR